MINRHKRLKAYKRFKPNPAYLELSFEVVKSIRAKRQINKLTKLLEKRLARDVDTSITNSNEKEQSLEQRIVARKASEAALDVKQKTKWEKKDKPKFPHKRYQAMWNNIAKESRKFILPKAIAAFATIDGLEKATEAIKYGMNVPGVKMDFGFVIKFLNKLTHIEVAKHLLARSNLSNFNKQEVLSSLITQEFPTATNKEPDYIKDMRQALKAVSQDKQNAENSINGSRPVRELQRKESFKNRTPTVKEKTSQRKKETGQNREEKIN